MADLEVYDEDSDEQLDAGEYANLVLEDAEGALKEFTAVIDYAGWDGYNALLEDLEE